MFVRQIGPADQMRPSIEDLVNGDRVCWQTPYTKTLQSAHDLLDFGPQHCPSSAEVHVISHSVRGS